MSKLILSTEGTEELPNRSSQLFSVVEIIDLKSDVEIFLFPIKKIFFTKNF